MTILEQRNMFNEKVEQYTLNMYIENKKVRTELEDVRCIIDQLHNRCDTPEKFIEALVLFRSVLDSNFPLSFLIVPENRYQIRNHFSKVIQDMKNLWEECKHS